MYEYAIIGAGLSGKLTALYLNHLKPGCQIVIFESRTDWPTHHTWSCFSSDIPQTLNAFSDTLPWKKWPQHDIQFPDQRRSLFIGYQSLKESDLNDLVSALSNIKIEFNTQVLSASQTDPFFELQLTSPTSPTSPTSSHSSSPPSASLAQAKQMFWCTGWPAQVKTRAGYQKFVGLEFKTSTQHGIQYPIIMDACVEQTDGYRFFYVLPFSENHIFIEDTYYSESPDLDIPAISQAIQDYLKLKTGLFGEIIYQEVGCLPIPLDSPDYNSDKKPAIGISASQFHPVTGYSLPAILRQLQGLPLGISLCKKPQWISILLNRFLFWAAPPPERWKVFSFFYRHSDQLIQKFYSGQMSGSDWITFFLKWPPPVKTLRAVFIAGRFAKEMTLRKRSEKLISS